MTQYNIDKIIKVLKKNPDGLWIRELARKTGLHMEQVRRCIDSPIFEETTPYNTEKKINLKIIKLSKQFKG